MRWDSQIARVFVVVCLFVCLLVLVSRHNVDLLFLV